MQNKKCKRFARRKATAYNSMFCNALLNAFGTPQNTQTVIGLAKVKI
jgi:hypothetical protein